MPARSSYLSIIFCLVSQLSATPVQESTSPTGQTQTEPTPKEDGKTVITSNRLEVINTEEGNRFIFEGDVVITGEDFTANCERMEVRTDSKGKDDFGAISVIEATGNVTVQQQSRIATAGRVLIHPEKDELILEDNPVVRDENGTVSGYRMILHGENRTISVEPGPEGQQPRVELPSIESIRESSENE
tara:strand:- start:46729 stop:47292 length:564 start_codon:yes stop_codon:yes gene_type:complete